MRVFLFGLSPRCINLMSLKSKLIQLVLSTPYLTHYLMSHCMPVCVYAHDMVFDSVSSIRVLSLYVCTLDFEFPSESWFSLIFTGQRLYLYAWIISLDHVHMCLSVHASWPYFCTHWVDSNNHGPACLDFRVWSLWNLQVADQSSAVEAWIIGRSSRTLLFQASARLSSFPIVARERSFVLLILVYLIVFHISRLLVMCNIHVILDHIL